MKPIRRTLPALVASLSLAIASAAGHAQVAEPGGPAPEARQPAVDPSAITGRTFSDLRLPLAVTDGRISLQALRAYVWTESDRIGGPAVQRVLLEGDVELRLGIYQFSAARATIWLQRLDDPGADVWQVFAYLDRAGIPADAGAFAISGDRLPVQGVIRAAAGVELRVDRLLEGRPRSAFLEQAESALAARLRRLVESPPPTAPPEELIRRGQPVPPIEPLDETREEALLRQRRDIARLEGRLEPTPVDAPIFARGGVISVSAGNIKLVPDADRQAVVISGKLTVSYVDRPPPGVVPSSMQMSAERGVIFLQQGAEAQAGRWAVGEVTGIYLEGDVQAVIESSQGKYTIRSPRVFYDVQQQRGLLVDAVFNTTDPSRNVPVWVRAKSIAQLSRDTFQATQARVTNTPFLEPDLSIGASSVTITKQTAPETDEQRVIVDARDVTLRAGDVPFFWWPRLKGDPSQFPLRDLRLENYSGSGGAIKTTWRGYTLLGLEGPEDTSLDLIADYYFERGPALGTEFSWRGVDMRGNLFAYVVPNDTGRDLLVTGVKEDQDGEFRGMVLGEHRTRPAQNWTVFAEGSYISDPTFVDGFFEPLGRTRREFTNSLYAQRIRDNSLLFGEVRANANDFIANQYLMQSPGYTVTRLPDVGYVRLADDLLDEYPGLLSYSSEYRVTHMRLEFPDPEVRELGFRTLGRSRAFFGIAPGQSVADALRAQGLTEDWVWRFDTRHELTMPLSAGPVNITPFVVGRFTGYDDDFREFSPDADEEYRLWGAAGVTLSTELQRVDNSVESRLLDLHRIRHIITPSVTIWHAATSINRTDMPVYDPSVESIAEGTATRFAVNQVWQTQRGGPGRWRSVDVFRLDTEVVVSSDDVDDETPINRYFSYRPEYSALGPTFLTVDAAWQVTEVLGLGFHEIFDFETNQSDRTSVGAVLQHAPEFSTFAELRYINPQDQTFALAGVNYELTRKYSVLASLNYDMDRGEVQSINTHFRRRYPSVVLGIGIGYNNITNETSLGFIVQPFGIGGSAAVRGVGSATEGFGVGG